MKKICKNDTVIVLTGKDKGKCSIVTQRINSDYLIVDGVNIVKKAIKPNPKTNTVGGFFNKTMPIHVSNVALFNSILKKTDTVVFKTINGTKVRTYKSTGEVIKV